MELKTQVDYSASKIAHTLLLNNDSGEVNLIAMTKDQAMQPHAAPADVMVTVVEGELEFTIGEVPQILRAGDYVTLSAGTFHSTRAVTDTKFLLVRLNIPTRS